jgi:hypothetical protein
MHRVRRPRSRTTGRERVGAARPDAVRASYKLRQGAPPADVGPRAEAARTAPWYAPCKNIGLRMPSAARRCMLAAPILMGNLRGAIECNTMRYCLAIVAHLGVRIAAPVDDASLWVLAYKRSGTSLMASHCDRGDAGDGNCRSGAHSRRSTHWRFIMLYTIAVILLVLWLLGLVTSFTAGGFLHVLLVIAVVMVVFQLISGRRVG